IILQRREHGLFYHALVGHLVPIALDEKHLVHEHTIWRQPLFQELKGALLRILDFDRHGHIVHQDGNRQGTPQPHPLSSAHVLRRRSIHPRGAAPFAHIHHQPEKRESQETQPAKTPESYSPTHHQSSAAKYS